MRGFGMEASRSVARWKYGLIRRAVARVKLQGSIADAPGRRLQYGSAGVNGAVVLRPSTLMMAARPLCWRLTKS